MIYFIFFAPPLLGAFILFAIFQSFLGSADQEVAYSRRVWWLWLTFSVLALIAQSVFFFTGAYSDLSSSEFSPIGTDIYGLLISYLTIAIPIFSLSSFIFLVRRVYAP